MPLSAVKLCRLIILIPRSLFGVACFMMFALNVWVFLLRQDRRPTWCHFLAGTCFSDTTQFNSSRPVSDVYCGLILKLNLMLIQWWCHILTLIRNGDASVSLLTQVTHSGNGNCDSFDQILDSGSYMINLSSNGLLVIFGPHSWKRKRYQRRRISMFVHMCVRDSRSWRGKKWEIFCLLICT